jgi:hypothetical protein
MEVSCSRHHITTKPELEVEANSESSDLEQPIPGYIPSIAVTAEINNTVWAVTPIAIGRMA